MRTLLAGEVEGIGSGVGEGATGPPPAVIANAVADAFEGRIEIHTPVFTPERVWTLLRRAGLT